jgi:hypothetical protein
MENRIIIQNMRRQLDLIVLHEQAENDIAITTI